MGSVGEPLAGEGVPSAGKGVPGGALVTASAPAPITGASGSAEVWLVGSFAGRSAVQQHIASVRKRPDAIGSDELIHGAVAKSEPSGAR